MECLFLRVLAPLSPSAVAGSLAPPTCCADSPNFVGLYTGASGMFMLRGVRLAAGGLVWAGARAGCERELGGCVVSCRVCSRVAVAACGVVRCAVPMELRGELPAARGEGQRAASKAAAKPSQASEREGNAARDHAQVSRARVVTRAQTTINNIAKSSSSLRKYECARWGAVPAVGTGRQRVTFSDAASSHINGRERVSGGRRARSWWRTRGVRRCGAGWPPRADAAGCGSHSS